MEFPGQRAAERVAEKVADAAKERARMWFVKLGDAVFEAMLPPPRNGESVEQVFQESPAICPDELAPPEEVLPADQLTGRP